MLYMDIEYVPGSKTWCNIWHISLFSRKWMLHLTFLHYSVSQMSSVIICNGFNQSVTQLGVSLGCVADFIAAIGCLIVCN